MYKHISGLPTLLEQRIFAAEQPPSAGAVLAAVAMGECVETIAAAHRYSTDPIQVQQPEADAATQLSPEQYMDTVRARWMGRQPHSALSPQELDLTRESPISVTSFTAEERNVLSATVVDYIQHHSMASIIESVRAHGHATRVSALLATRARLLAELVGFAAAPRILAGDAYAEEAAAAVGTGDLPPFRLALPDILAMPAEDFSSHTQAILGQATQLCAITSRIHPKLLLLDGQGSVPNPNSVLIGTGIRTLMGLPRNAKSSQQALEQAYHETVPKVLGHTSDSVVRPWPGLVHVDLSGLDKTVAALRQWPEIMALRERQRHDINTFHTLPDGPQIMDAIQRREPVHIQHQEIRLRNQALMARMTNSARGIVYTLHHLANPDWQWQNKLHVPIDHVEQGAIKFVADLADPDTHPRRVIGYSIHVEPAGAARILEAQQATGQQISGDALMVYVGVMRQARRDVIPFYRGAAMLVDSRQPNQEDEVLTLFAHCEPSDHVSNTSFPFIRVKQK